MEGSTTEPSRAQPMMMSGDAMESSRSHDPPRGVPPGLEPLLDMSLDNFASPNGPQSLLSDTKASSKSIYLAAKATIRLDKGNKSAYREFEDLIGMEELEQLINCFVDPLTGKHVELGEEEFVQGVCEVLPKKTPNEVRKWYRVIDADDTKTVDWEEFSSFILSHGKPRAAMEQKGLEYVAQPCPQQCPANHRHQNSMTCMLIHPKTGQVFTGGQDGTIRVWSGQSLQFERLLFNGTSWITDMKFMHNENRLMASTVQRKIFVFDVKAMVVVRCYAGREISETEEGVRYAVETVETVELRNAVDTRRTGTEVDSGRSTMKLATAGVQDSVDDFRNFMENQRLVRATRKKMDTTALSNLTETPTVMEYYHNSVGEDVVLLGSRKGAVSIYTLPVSFQRVVSRQTFFPVHDGRINAMRVSRFLGGLLSVSEDNTMRITDLITERLTKTFDTSNTHTKGIHTLDWTEEGKMMVTAGTERVVAVWNNTRDVPLFQLTGHTTPVISCTLQEDRNKIVSLGSDLTVKIWDLRTYKCLQTFQDRTTVVTSSNHVCSGIHYDSETDRIFMGASYPVFFGTRQQASLFPSTYTGHTAPLVGCAYNDHSAQLVTVDAEVVHLWDPDQGDSLFCFTASSFQSQIDKAQDMRITCVGFDEKQKRLMLGTHNGHVLVSNFNNGQCLNTMKHKSLSTEVFCVKSVCRFDDVFYCASIAGSIIVAKEVHHQIQITNVLKFDIPTHPHTLRSDELAGALVPVSPQVVACGTTAARIVFFHTLTVEQDGYIVDTMPDEFWSAGLGKAPPRMDRLLPCARLGEEFLLGFFIDGRITVVDTRRRCICGNVDVTEDDTTMVVNFALDCNVQELVAFSDELGNAFVWSLQGITPERARNREVCQDNIFPLFSFGVVSQVPITGLTFVHSTLCASAGVFGGEQFTETFRDLLPAEYEGLMIVTTQGDCSVKLFTMDGCCIGSFGARRWIAHHDGTWESKEAIPVFSPDFTHGTGTAQISASMIFDEGQACDPIRPDNTFGSCDRFTLPSVFRGNATNSTQMPSLTLNSGTGTMHTQRSDVTPYSVPVSFTPRIPKVPAVRHPTRQSIRRSVSQKPELNLSGSYTSMSPTFGAPQAPLSTASNNPSFRLASRESTKALLKRSPVTPALSPSAAYHARPLSVDAETSQGMSNVVTPKENDLSKAMGGGDDVSADFISQQLKKLQTVRRNDERLDTAWHRTEVEDYGERPAVSRGTTSGKGGIQNWTERVSSLIECHKPIEAQFQGIRKGFDQVRGVNAKASIFGGVPSRKVTSSSSATQHVPQTARR